MSEKIKPRTLSGTLELLPNDQIVFNKMIDDVTKKLNCVVRDK